MEVNPNQYVANDILPNEVMLNVFQHFNSAELKVAALTAKQFAEISRYRQQYLTQQEKKDYQAKVFSYNLKHELKPENQSEVNKKSAPIVDRALLSKYQQEVQLESDEVPKHVEVTEAFILVMSEVKPQKKSKKDLGIFEKQVKVFNRQTGQFLLTVPASANPVNSLSRPSERLFRVNSQSFLSCHLHSDKYLLWMDTHCIKIYNLQEQKEVVFNPAVSIGENGVTYKGKFAHVLNEHLLSFSEPSKFNIVDLKKTENKRELELGISCTNDEAEIIEPAMYEKGLIFIGKDTEKNNQLKVLDKEWKLSTYLFPESVKGDLIAVNYLESNRIAVATKNKDGEGRDKLFYHFLTLNEDKTLKAFAEPIEFQATDYIQIQNGVFTKLSLIDENDPENPKYEILFQFPDLNVYRLTVPKLRSYIVSPEGFAAEPFYKDSPLIWSKLTDSIGIYSAEQLKYNWPFELVGMMHGHVIYQGKGQENSRLFVHDMQATPIKNEQGQNIINVSNILRIDKKAKVIETSQNNIYYFNSKENKITLLEIDKIILSKQDRDRVSLLTNQPIEKKQNSVDSNKSSAKKVEKKKPKTHNAKSKSESALLDEVVRDKIQKIFYANRNPNA